MLGRAASWAGSQEAESETGLGCMSFVEGICSEKARREDSGRKVKRKSKQGCGLGQRLALP